MDHPMIVVASSEPVQHKAVQRTRPVQTGLSAIVYDLAVARRFVVRLQWRCEHLAANNFCPATTFPPCLACAACTHRFPADSRESSIDQPNEAMYDEQISGEKQPPRAHIN
eukprot:1887208-Amphidinium_carterae.1